MRKIAVNIVALLIFTMTIVVASNGQSNDNSNASKKQPDRQQSKDQPVKIKSKPVIRMGRCSESSGLVTLRATFDKSAVVTKVEIVKSSDCDSFDKNAVKAAQGIKFSPAIKNGEPVTINKIVQYSFSGY